MIKRILSAALAVSLVFGGGAVMPEGAVTFDLQIEANAYTYGDFECEYSSQLGREGYVIKKYLGSDKIIKIPETINGDPVVAIGDNAFDPSDWNGNENCSNIISVDIPATVKEIGYMAFYDCSSLKTVNLPNSNINISAYAFDDTPFMYDMKGDSDIVIINNILFRADNVKGNYTIPDGVISIAGAAFRYSGDVTSVTIPSSVKILSDYAFENNFGELDSLKTVTVKGSITEIGYHCFKDCKNLENVDIPNSLQEIKAYAFSGCEKFSKAISIPASAIRVWNNAFENSGITSVTIPAGVHYARAFANCHDLKEITVNGDHIEFPTNAVEGCENLSTLRLNGEYPDINDEYGEPLNTKTKVIAHAGSSAISYAQRNGNPYEATDHIKFSSFDVDENGVETPTGGISYSSDKAELIVPDKHNGVTVTSVNIYDDNVRSVKLPKTVEWFYINKPSSDLKIYCYSNSKALEIAKKNNYKYELLDPHTHSYTSKVTTAATCTKEGVKTFTCSCGDTYTEKIAKTAHKYTTKVIAPTYDAQGYTLHTCSVCGDSYKDNYKAKLTKASIAKATVSGIKNKYYTGKALTQAPVVKLGSKTLKSGTDYTVTYKNNKAVGKATVTITGKGNYTGTVSKTFKINPKKTTLKTATSPKTKQLKVTYSKVSGATGYQITYSTSSKFAKASTKSANSSKTSKTISKLTKGKTYYVKVRTYKTVKGTKYYSGYSAVKKVKVK